MKKIFLISLSVVLLISTAYYLVSNKRSLNPVPITNTNKDAIGLQKLIKQQESIPVANPPASIYKCLYRNQSVFYLPPRCCDIPGIIFNEKGESICSPDGGFPGKGDVRCADFSAIEKDCIVVWKDSRR